MGQAMGWFADSMRLRDVLQVVSSIEIPLPAAQEETSHHRLEEGEGGADSCPGLA